MNQTNIRVLIADDHPVVRTGLALMIKYEPGMEVIAEAGDGTQAMELFRQYQPDVTLMDLRMPSMGGVEAIVAIRQEFTDACIIVLTTYDGDEDIHRGLQAGAKGYLLKGASCDQLLEAIRKVHAGQTYISALVGAKLAQRLSGPQLSKREQDVLALLATGMNNREIAKTLCVTENTIKFHVNNILSKLQVSDRTQAALIALKRGIANL